MQKQETNQPTAAPTEGAQAYPLLLKTFQQTDKKVSELVRKHPVASMGLAVCLGYVSHSFFKKFAAKKDT